MILLLEAIAISWIILVALALITHRNAGLTLALGENIHRLTVSNAMLG